MFWEGGILVYDNLAAAQAPAQFDWLLHLPDRGGLEIGKDDVIYRGSKAALGIRRLFPADGAFHVENGHLPYAILIPAAPASLPRQPAILKLSANAASGRTHFLVALFTSGSEQKARERVNLLHAFDEPAWLVVERQTIRQEELHLLPQGAIPWRSGQRPVVHRRGSLDAMRLDVPGQTVGLLAAQGATVLKRGGQVLFSSPRPVSFAAEYAGGEIILTVNATAPGRIRVARQDGSLADVEVAAGQQQMTLR